MPRELIHVDAAIIKVEIADDGYDLFFLKDLDWPIAMWGGFGWIKHSRKPRVGDKLIGSVYRVPNQQRYWHEIGDFEAELCIDTVLEDEMPEKGMRFNKNVVQLALDLHQSGKTLRETQKHLADTLHVRVSHVAIWKWIRRAAGKGN